MQLLALGIADLISISIKRLASFGITPFFHGFLWVRFFKTSATPQTYPQNHDIKRHYASSVGIKKPRRLNLVDNDFTYLLFMMNNREQFW